MNDLLPKMECVALSFAILANALLTRRIVGSWSAPAAIFSAFWFVMTFIPLLVLPEAPASPWALVYIAAACVAMSLSIGLKRWPQAWHKRLYFASVSPPLYTNAFLATAFVGCAAGAVICIMVDVFTQGFSASDLTTNLMGTASEYISRRYSQDLTHTLFGTTGNVLSYTASALGGVIIMGRKRWQQVITALLSFLPGVLVMTIQGAKGMLFLNLALFFAGTILFRLQRGDSRVINKKFVIKGAPYVALLVAILTFAFLSRGVHVTSMRDAIEPLSHMYASYAAGHLYAFSDWLTFYTGGDSSQAYDYQPPTYGFYTFMSLFQLFGDKRDVYIGIYDEYFTYSYYLQTNIYTVFRGLIQDFGIFPSLVVIGAFGFLANELYYDVIIKPFTPIKSALYILVIGFIYMSYLISMMIWAAPVVAIFLVAFILFLNGSTFVSLARKLARRPASGRLAPR